MNNTASYQFQDILEVVATWPLQDQSLLVEIVQRRLAQKRRAEIVQEIQESRAAYQVGDVQHGSVADLMAELDD